VKGQGKLNRHIIFESALILFAKKNIEISPCISKLQLDKVGTFLLRHCRREMSRSVDRLHHTWTRRDSMLTVSIAVIHSVRRREDDNDDGLIIVSALTSRRHHRTACVWLSECSTLIHTHAALASIFYSPRSLRRHCNTFTRPQIDFLTEVTPALINQSIIVNFKDRQTDRQNRQIYYFKTVQHTAMQHAHKHR